LRSAATNFEVEFYPNSEMPKSYKSWLTVLKTGRSHEKAIISERSADPTRASPFYQSVTAWCRTAWEKRCCPEGCFQKTARPEQLNLKFGSTFYHSGTEVTGTIRDFSPALSFDQSGRAFTYAEQMSNPADSMVDFAIKGPRFGGWILKRFPRTMGPPDGNRVGFPRLLGCAIYRMQVRRDPGVFIVYLDV